MRNWTPGKIRALKGKRKFATVTCYDATSASIIETLGSDLFPLVLVGDSLANTMQGYDTALPVTVEDVIYHTRCVGRILKNALLLSDLPFGSYQVNDDDGFRAAVRIIKEGGADAVKLEGGERCIALVRRLVEAGIPVCGHLGLTPQSCLAMGFRVQARDEQAAERLIEEAKMLEAAGCFALVVECIPSTLGAKVAAALTIPVIGIGAGVETDAQILVWQDLLGLNQNKLAKFVRRFGDLGEAAKSALTDYATAVGEGTYPSPDESYA